MYMLATHCLDVLSNVVLSICHAAHSLQPSVSCTKMTITGHAQEAINVPAPLEVAVYHFMCLYSLMMCD